MIFVSFVCVARDGDGAWGVARETGERVTWDLAGDVVARVWIDGGARDALVRARSRADGDSARVNARVMFCFRA